MMKLQTAVKKTTFTIAVGTFLLSAVMILVFALLNRFDWTVITGALWGTVFAVLNFFLMAVSVQSAADLSAAESTETEGSAETETEEAAAENHEDRLKNSPPLSENAKAIRRKMQLSYTGRMLMLVAAAIIAVVAPCFHTVAAILPLVFPQIIIRIPGVMNKEA